MDQTKFEEAPRSVEREENNVASRLYEAARDLGTATVIGAAAGYAGAGLAKFAQSQLPTIEFSKPFNSLPKLDLTGFDQEAPYQSQGGLKDIWHSIKHAFSKDQTLDQKIEEHCQSKMTKEERQKFDAENKALADHQRRVLAWSATMMVPPPPYPQKPDTPMHQEIDRRAEALEKSITKSVRDNMSPTDLIRLDKSIGDYKRRVEESQKIRNPIGTGEGFRPLPSPGSTIQDYFLRVSEATAKYLKEH